MGEIAEKIKKFYRDGGNPEAFRTEITKEFGDVFYYFAKIHNFFDIKMSTSLRLNVDKLSSRKTRGTLAGSGDNR